MKKLCVLLTTNYPYNKEETFIESEIEYLAETFDSVVIISIYASSQDLQTRSIPSNVVPVCLGFSLITPIQKVIAGISGLIHANAEIRKEINRVDSLHWKTNCSFMYGNSLSMKKKSISVLDSLINWNEFHSCVFYSYWFVEHAMLAIALKSHYSKFLGSRAVSRAHGYDVYAFRRQYKTFPFREMNLQLIDGVYPCSEDGKRHIIENYPAYQSKIHTAYLGTNDRGLNPFIQDPIITMVTCSNIVELKRLDFIANAIAFLSEKGNDQFHWICIGDGPCLESLQHLVCKELHIEKQVEFLGRMCNEAVMEYYQTHSIDLFVNVSESEGLPVSIMEAQSFGIPCIATNVGGTSEIVSDSVGYLLPSSITVEELATQFERFSMLRGKDVSELRSRTRKQWEEKFSAEKNFKEWSDTIATL